MLDNNAIKVLKYFIKTNTSQDIFTIACNVRLSKDNSKLVSLSESAVNDLLETNCIKYIDNGYQLTNFGKMYFKNNLKNNFIKYIYPLITSSISLIINLLLQ